MKILNHNPLRSISYLLVLLALALMACSSDEDAGKVTVPAAVERTEVQYKTLAGVDPSLLSLDVYRLDNTTVSKPVIIYVHGGAWAVGDKRNQVDNKVDLFTQNYVFVSVNYRLSPAQHDLNNSSRVKFPDHNQDVADAIKWVVDNISSYGGDAGKIALMGHSAGAHLASLTATNPDFLQNAGLDLSAITCVASIDTQAYDIPALIGTSPLYENAFGSDTSDHERASPLLQIQTGTSYPAFLVVQRGTATRRQLQQNFIDALQNTNNDLTIVDAQSYTHEGVNATIGQEGETIITPQLLHFFKTHLR